MASSSPSSEISVGVDDKNVNSDLGAIGDSVKRLGLMTETAFSKQNRGVLGHELRRRQGGDGEADQGIPRPRHLGQGPDRESAQVPDQGLDAVPGMHLAQL